MAALLMTFALNARERSEESARDMAERFFASMPVTKSHTVELEMIWDRTSPATRAGDEPAFYVFANSQGPGFVIISGDDAARTVLGYSFDEYFPAEDMPPHLVSWMEEIENQVRYIRENDVPSSVSPASVEGTVVKELETARWNQGSPYNRKCPYDGSVHAVTGCVATAMAIVLHYHKWPDAGVGVIPEYTTATKKINVPEIALGEKYDWDNMPMTFSGSSTPENVQAVATLMADCGAMIRMDYTAGESGAYTGDVPTALSTYMKYDAGISIYERGFYEESRWHAMLQKEMNERGPVIFSGRSEYGGHCFVLDGYTTDNYYRVNWGWGGAYNGYYSLDAMEPGGQGIGGSGSYNYNQQVILDVRKAQGGVPPEKFYIVEYDGVASISSESSVFVTGVPFVVNTGLLMNSSTVPYSGHIGLAVVDREGEVKEVLYQITATDLSPNYGYLIRNRSLVIKSELEIGDKLIAVFWNNQKNGWEKIPGNRYDSPVDYIPLADSESIEESTTFDYDGESGVAVLTFKDGVDAVMTDSSGADASRYVARDGNRMQIFLKDMPAGRYLLVMTKGTERKELYLVAGTKEVANE